VYYANTLLRRAGLISPDEFLAELNATVTKQLANAHAAASNDEIRRDFITDDAVSLVPYTRGALYAAELDAAIRHASHGRRSLDDAIRELYHAAWPAHAGAGLAGDAFRAMVVRELGAPGAARYDAVIVRGGSPDPPSDAFGPCFVREPRQVALFQLGFDERASRVEPPAIRGLIAGSGAARAGLVAGDRLISIESAFLDPDTEAVVTVARGGRPVAVRYLPAGPRRAGYRWVRVKDRPDQRCDGPSAP
jgi:predicted metalloprotease with PDZ domain